MAYYPTLKQPVLRRPLEPKLAALVGIDDVRHAVLRERVLDDLAGMASLQCDRHLVRQHLATEHVHPHSDLYAAVARPVIGRSYCGAAEHGTGVNKTCEKRLLNGTKEH